MAPATPSPTNRVAAQLWRAERALFGRLVTVNTRGRALIAAGDPDAGARAIKGLAAQKTPENLPLVQRQAIRELKNMWFVELMELDANRAARAFATWKRELIARAGGRP